MKLLSQFLLYIPVLIDALLVGPWREYEDQIKVSCPTPEEKAIIEAQKGSKLKKKRRDEEEETIEETTILHSKRRKYHCLDPPLFFPTLVDDPVDYMGRSFLHIPQDIGINLKSEDPPEKCFIPKKCIHTW